jgi:hypothetical protein
MRNLILIVASLCMTILLGASPGVAAGAGSYLKLPEAAQTLKPDVQLVGYKHCDYSGCYYCQYRKCDSYYSCGYYKRCCSSYHYYDCDSYSGGGGYYKRKYHGGGGGGY